MTFVGARPKKTTALSAVVCVATHVGIETAIIIAVIPIGFAALLGILGVEAGDFFAILVPHERSLLASELCDGFRSFEARVSAFGINASDRGSTNVNCVSIHNYYFLSFFVS
jgi:hypothetical protein